MMVILFRETFCRYGPTIIFKLTSSQVKKEAKRSLSL